jgi:hypothetical protein
MSTYRTARLIQAKAQRDAAIVISVCLVVAGTQLQYG